MRNINLNKIKELQAALESNSNIDSNIKSVLLECGYILHEHNYEIEDLIQLSSVIELIPVQLKDKVFNLVKTNLYFDKTKLSEDTDLVHLIFLEIAFPNLQTENKALLVGYTQMIANNLIGNHSNKLINPDEYNIVDTLAKIIGLEPFEDMLKTRSIQPIISSLTNLGATNDEILQLLKTVEENFIHKNAPSNRYSKIMRMLSEILCSYGIANTQSHSSDEFLSTSFHSKNIFEENHENYLELDELNISIDTTNIQNLDTSSLKI